MLLCDLCILDTNQNMYALWNNEILFSMQIYCVYEKFAYILYLLITHYSSNGNNYKLVFNELDQGKCKVAYSWWKMRIYVKHIVKYADDTEALWIN